MRSDLTALRDTKNPSQSIHVDVRALVEAIREGRAG